MDERPKEFDDRVLAYMPGLENLARRLQPRDHESLLNETVVYALTNWQKFRADGSFWFWASINMRSIARDNRNRENRIPAFCGIERAERISAEGNQEHAADLAKIRGILSTREGIVLVRHATGETMREIGADMGISYERVRQLCDVARARLLAEVA